MWLLWCPTSFLPNTKSAFQLCRHINHFFFSEKSTFQSIWLKLSSAFTSHSSDMSFSVSLQPSQSAVREEDWTNAEADNELSQNFFICCKEVSLQNAMWKDKLFAMFLICYTPSRHELKLQMVILYSRTKCMTEVTNRFYCLHVATV